MVPRKYTQEQLENLCNYLGSSEYPWDSSSFSSHSELTAAYVLLRCEFDMVKVLESYVSHKLDLMDFGDEAREGVTTENINSFITYYLVRALSLKTEDLPLYINSKVHVVKHVILWRIGKGL